MGREIARLLARDGYRVAVVGRRREPLDTLAQELDAEGVPLWVYPADIAEPGAPDRLVAQVAADEHHHPIRDMFDHRKIMGDEDHRKAQLAAQFGQKVDHLCLDRHI